MRSFAGILLLCAVSSAYAESKEAFLDAWKDLQLSFKQADTKPGLRTRVTNRNPSEVRKYMEITKQSDPIVAAISQKADAFEARFGKGKEANKTGKQYFGRSFAKVRRQEKLTVPSALLSNIRRGEKNYAKSKALAHKVLGHAADLDAANARAAADAEARRQARAETRRASEEASRREHQALRNKIANEKAARAEARKEYFATDAATLATRRAEVTAKNEQLHHSPAYKGPDSIRAVVQATLDIVQRRRSAPDYQPRYVNAYIENSWQVKGRDEYGEPNQYSILMSIVYTDPDIEKYDLAFASRCNMLTPERRGVQPQLPVVKEALFCSTPYYVLLSKHN